MKPLIALTTYRERAAWGVWNEPADLLPASYADEVTEAGGIPVLVPPAVPDAREAAEAVLDGVHGVVLAGGADVDPARYGAHRNPHTGPARENRDAWELDLARAALERDVPLFAICRGMQVLNVALGGSLVQHLPDAVGHDEHCPTVGVHGRHEVRTEPQTRLHAILGDNALVATYHHQAVARLGSGLRPTAWAGDDTVEAVERDGRWILGVQWHPEVHDGAALFASFVGACVEFRASRGR
jgi:gamma-glutamyl-gamma-aminobutyrate hydrolase PuuD